MVFGVFFAVPINFGEGSAGAATFSCGFFPARLS